MFNKGDGMTVRARLNGTTTKSSRKTNIVGTVSMNMNCCFS